MKNETEYTNIRIWRRTRKNLRLLAAKEEKSMVEVLDDLVAKGLKDFEVKKC